MTDQLILQVALDAPLRQVFDYLAPASARFRPQPGVRVRVPFGRRQLVGVILALAHQSDVPQAKLRPALEILDAEPVVDASLRRLLEFAARYYHHPIGEVVAAALPKLARQGATAVELLECWHATQAGLEAIAAGEPRRAPKQRAVLEFVAQQTRMSGTNGATVELLNAAVPGWRDAVRALTARDWLASAEQERAATDARDGALMRTNRLDPTAEQLVAIQAIEAALGRYSAFLLQGITGSGKTEVYLRVIETALRAGRRALVLVPEIGLTPQLVARFTARFHVSLAVLHSGLTDTERLAAWRATVAGDARIVIGTRSAVFAPVSDLGVLIVDEEHDASFKQQDTAFRYSARDLAIVRAQQSAVPIVLGSATPSIESLHNATLGRYTVLSLPRRTGQSLPPRAATIDLRQHAVRQGLSTPAAEAIRRHLANDGQVLVFINRRGYAPSLVCTACGWMAPCSDCDARLTVHLGAAQLRCHHCGAQAPLPEHCLQCGYAVRPVGQGTERVEATLAEWFPEVPIARLDRDVVRRRGDAEDVMTRVASGEARILVGTQMVTKGHDFPNVTLVVVLNADQGLFSTDFRAPERLAQTIVQVAGRAGRGEKPGEVLIQSEYPEHPLLQNLLHEGYEGFARQALAERAASGWPPFARLAALRASAPALATAVAFLRDARVAIQPPPGLKLLGPVPAAMAKRAARYHAQLLVECADRTALHQFIDAWLPRLESLTTPRDLRWSLDIDPLELS
ncbi:MAG: primosomal protein N' [Steroidobacteraceae bacterium]|nr:primosomal protein N' [Steroidobacteraceae bacterium]